jgi:tellurite resistance-related uncharacterized protein
MTRIMTTLPPGLACYRETAEFNRETVPAALLQAHRIKADVWGLLRVLRGRVRYSIDDEAPETAVVAAGAVAVIEPGLAHHVELLDADSAFRVEFYRRSPN